MKIIVVVEGGVVQSVQTDAAAEVMIIDWDNLEAPGSSDKPEWGKADVRTREQLLNVALEATDWCADRDHNGGEGL